MILKDVMGETCQECGVVFENFNRFLRHLKSHNMILQNYYDKFYKILEDGSCVICKKDTKFCYSIKYEDINGVQLEHVGYRKMCKSCSVGVTLDKLIIRYGEELGKQKWKRYCDKQSRSMSFEYKKSKYGWTEEQYHTLNKSYGRSLSNFVEKYGQEIGNQKYIETVENIKYTQSKEYYKDKYGDNWEEEWEAVCKSKSTSLKSYIEKYGKDIGTKKFLKKIEKATPYISKMSQDLFDVIYKEIYTSDNKIYYGRLNKEFGKLYNDEYYLYDFVDLDNKKVIEFNGECFHTRTPDNKNYFNFRKPEETAEESFKKDLLKKQAIESLGFEIFYVWEDDYNKDKERVKNECIKFLKNQM